MCVRLVFAVVVLLFGAIAGAQPVVKEGSRVRIEIRREAVVPGTGEGVPLVGRIEAMRDDVLVIALKGRATPLSLPRSAIVRLEVSQGRQTGGAGFLRGAGLGLFLGAAGGALFGIAANSSGDGLFNYSTGDTAALGAIYGGALGVLIGGSLGIAFPGERWSAVPLKRTHVHVMPAARGLGVRVAVSF
jgi:hypothetical protein